MNFHEDALPKAVITPETITVQTEGSISWGGFTAHLVRKGEMGPQARVLLARREWVGKQPLFVLKHESGVEEWATLIRDRGNKAVSLTFPNHTGKAARIDLDEAWIKSAGLTLKT
jgi:hypothetical protein